MSGSTAAPIVGNNITFGTLESNRDIYLGTDGNLVILTGLQALLQDCESALRAQLGEMVLQPLDGMPTFDDVWLGRNFPKYKSAAIKAINKINGVTRVQSFQFAQVGQQFFYVALIKTVYGPASNQIVGSLNDLVNAITSPTTGTGAPIPGGNNTLGNFILDTSTLG